MGKANMAKTIKIYTVKIKFNCNLRQLVATCGNLASKKFQEKGLLP
jgi:hypothetical protein